MSKSFIPILSYIFLQILGSLVLERTYVGLMKNILSAILLVAPHYSDKNEKN